MGFRQTAVAIRPLEALALNRNSLRRLSMQSLEKRCLLAGDVSLSEGILSVVGDESPNEIVALANQEENRLTIVLDGERFAFQNDQVQHININGRAGDDRIVIRPSIRQATTLVGGLGNDYLMGSNQADRILGGPGNDRINGAGGDDWIDGGEGNDGIHGGPGNDEIRGGTGSDVIRGEAGNDFVLGDPMETEESSNESTDETISLSEALGRSSSMRENALNFGDRVDATLHLAQPMSSEDSFNDLIFGGDGDDRLQGNRGIDVIYGGRGNDRISGGPGVDFIEGEAGNDVLEGGPAVDILFGGTGNDQIFGGRGNDYLIGGSGNDQLDGGMGRDWLFGDATNSYIWGYVDPVHYARDFRDVGRGEDVLNGGDGDDVLLGGNLSDRLYGGEGNDLLVGGAGSDHLAGGAGADVINARDNEVDWVLSDSNDTLYLDKLDHLLS